MHYGLPLGHKKSKAAKEVRNLLYNQQFIEAFIFSQD